MNREAGKGGERDMYIMCMYCILNIGYMIMICIMFN